MRARAWWEVLGFYGLTIASIWIGQRYNLKGEIWIGAVVILAIAGLSAKWHGDSKERLGLDRKWLAPCAKLVLIYVVPALVLMLVWALTRELQPTGRKMFFWIVGYPFWAFAQEYALLSFAANRISDGTGGRPWLTSLVNGALFAAVHFPNPVLMAACFVSGVVFTRIFLKTPHILPLALAHAAGGILLSWIFLGQYNAMMVGPGYWKHAFTLGPHP